MRRSDLILKEKKAFVYDELIHKDALVFVNGTLLREGKNNDYEVKKKGHLVWTETVIPNTFDLVTIISFKKKFFLW